MSERHIHVYRTTEVAEYHVDDDGIYEDDADMLRDVIEAADQGILDFEAADARFVAMVWDEENQLVVREVVGEGVKREGEDRYCEICLAKQFKTEGGWTCQRGHGGAGGISRTAANAERARRADARAERLGPEPEAVPAARPRTARVRPGARRRSS
jgi:hypothetical protein